MKIYLLVGENGEYSDRRNWFVHAYSSRDAAEAHKAGIEDWIKKNWPADRWDLGWQGEQELETAIKAIDPGWCSYSSDTGTYSVVEIAFD